MSGGAGKIFFDVLSWRMTQGAASMKEAFLDVTAAGVGHRSSST